MNYKLFFNINLVLLFFSGVTLLTTHTKIELINNCYLYTVLLVDGLVKDYFYTFRYCWTIILGILDSLITNYFIFLGYMIDHMLVYPTVLILGTTSCILLWIVRIIIHDIIKI